MKRVLVRTLAYGNATTRTGKIVHESSRSGYPLCGVYMRVIMYTDGAVNCPRCKAAARRLGYE